MTTINLDYQPDAAYYGDCADIMTAWKEKGVQGIIDLIYLDPPFNSNRNYGVPTSKAKDSDTGSMDAFTDMWTWDERSAERVEVILKTPAHPARELFASLRGYLEKRDAGMLAYLSYMADRLWLCQQLLKETGSIYLHCDPTANYYLRLLMDAIFSPQNYRNEIVWHYNRFSRRGDAFPSMHDTILFYGKGKGTKFNKLFTDLRDSTRLKKGWQTVVDQGVKKLLVYNQENYEKAVELGKIKPEKYDKIVPTNARQPAMGNVWGIPFINSQSKEREGYPTQKPLALLDRIIKASTNEGDIVFDPFCGCGTSIHSAINNSRRFIGIDISVFSIHSVTHKRIKSKCGIDIPVYGIPTNITGARMLAKQDPFAFEAWAAETLNFGDIGILSNKIKRVDGGIDGKGLLYGKTEDGEDEVIVQVKSGRVSVDSVRAFAEVIKSNPKVAAGIFITLDDKEWTKGFEQKALSLGTFKMPNGTRRFRRMQHWPVSDRFKNKGEGEYPKMPIMVNPLNGKPLVNIGTTIQSDLA